MATYGIPEADIARVIGIDPKTLRKHYRDELDTGHIMALAKVAESLFRKATSDSPQSVTTAIFWLKTRGGWRENPRDQHSTQNTDLSKHSDEELDGMIAALQKTMAEQNLLPAPAADEESDDARSGEGVYHCPCAMSHRRSDLRCLRLAEAFMERIA